MFEGAVCMEGFTIVPNLQVALAHDVTGHCSCDTTMLMEVMNGQSNDGRRLKLGLKPEVRNNAMACLAAY